MNQCQKTPLECNTNSIWILQNICIFCSELKAVTEDGKKTAFLVKEKKESSEETQFIEASNTNGVHVINEISYPDRFGAINVVRQSLL